MATTPQETWKDKMRAEGRCTVCGDMASERNKRYCEKHRRHYATRARASERRKERGRERREERVAAGLCARCGKEPPDPDKTQCGPCLQVLREGAERQRRARGTKARSKGEQSKPLGVRTLQKPINTLAQAIREDPDVKREHAEALRKRLTWGEADMVPTVNAIERVVKTWSDAQSNG